VEVRATTDVQVGQKSLESPKHFQQKRFIFHSFVARGKLIDPGTAAGP